MKSKEVKQVCLNRGGSDPSSSDSLIHYPAAPIFKTPLKKRKSPAFLAYIRTLSCLICGQTPCDPHHLPVEGHTRRYQDIENVVPMCRGCHCMSHKHPPMESRYHLKDKAVKIYKAWRIKNGTIKS